MVQFQRTIDKDNRTILKAIRLEQRELDRTGRPDVTTTPAEKEKGSPAGGKPDVTATDRQQGQGRPPDNTGNNNTGNRGKGTSRNT